VRQSSRSTFPVSALNILGGCCRPRGFDRHSGDRSAITLSFMLLLKSSWRCRCFCFALPRQGGGACIAAAALLGPANEMRTAWCRRMHSQTVLPAAVAEPPCGSLRLHGCKTHLAATIKPLNPLNVSFADACRPQNDPGRQRSRAGSFGFLLLR